MRAVAIAFIGIGSFAAPAAAASIQFDFSQVFNADVIRNGDPSVPGGLDPTQQGIDNNGLFFFTQAADPGGGAYGLPNDGFFPAVSDYFHQSLEHPDLQLPYRNSDNGNNARSTRNSAETYTVAVPPLFYSDVFVFMTGGSGLGVLDVRLNYADGSVSSCGDVVPDWFTGHSSEPPALANWEFILAYDRGSDGSGYGASGRSIYGIQCSRLFAVDANSLLTSLTITAEPTSGSVVNVFGGVGFALDGQVIPDPVAVPEPVTGVMLVLGIGELARRHRGRARATSWRWR